MPVPLRKKGDWHYGFGQTCAMPKYYVLINGQNFLLNKHGRMAKYGFFTTRCVVADGPAQAEVNAVKMLRRNQSLKHLVHNESDDEPVLYIEEISRVESFHDLPGSRQGFSWYPEDD